MSHEELIVKLASEARPVQPLPAPGVRMARWALLAVVAVCVGVAMRGLRSNWAAAVGDPTFEITNVLILIVAVTAGWAALSLSVPGALRSPALKWVPLLALGAWGAVLLQDVAATGNVMSALVNERVIVACMWKTYGVAIGPALVILLLARRAAPLDWRWTGGLAALSALAFGVVGTELICPLTRGAHLFNYHYLPVAGMTLVAFVVGSWWGRRAFRSEVRGPRS